MSLHILDNAFLCALFATSEKFEVWTTFVIKESYVRPNVTTRFDLPFLSPNEQFEIPDLEHKDFKCMKRTTKRFSGEKYVSLANNKNRPNIISIVIECARFEEWTQELKIGDLDLTPNFNALKKRGITWTNLHSVNFNTKSSSIIMGGGRYNSREGGPSCNPKISNFEALIKERLGYNIGRFDVDGYDDLCPVDRLVQKGTKYDLDDVEEYLKALKSFHKESQEQGKPFYMEFHPEGTHHQWTYQRPEDKVFFEKVENSGDMHAFATSRVERGYPNFMKNAPAKSQSIHHYKNMIKVLHTSDKMLGRIVEELKSSGMSKNTVLIITGDHAISNHHQIGQSARAYEEQFHIPYVMTDLEGDVLTNYKPGSIVPQLHTNLDYGVTILDLLNIKNFPNFGVGHSMLRKAPENDTRHTFSMFYQKNTVRNTTHTMMYERCKGEPCWNVKEFNRKEDPTSTGKPKSYKVAYDDHKGLKRMMMFEKLKEHWNLQRNTVMIM
eukprot:Pgem_evm1s2179